jgi:hypothetical protein
MNTVEVLVTGSSGYAASEMTSLLKFKISSMLIRFFQNILTFTLVRKQIANLLYTGWIREV